MSSDAHSTSVDIDAAERFMLANARLLDRRRLAVLLHGAPVDPVLAALRPYRNPDGGFGHALEPDIRAPTSEPSATLHALVVLAEVGALEDPMLGEAAAWVAAIAEPDGGVPFSLPPRLPIRTRRSSRYQPHRGARSSRWRSQACCGRRARTSRGWSARRAGRGRGSSSPTTSMPTA